MIPGSTRRLPLQPVHRHEPQAAQATGEADTTAPRQAVTPQPSPSGNRVRKRLRLMERSVNSNPFSKVPQDVFVKIADCLSNGKDVLSMSMMDKSTHLKLSELLGWHRAANHGASQAATLEGLQASLQQIMGLHGAHAGPLRRLMPRIGLIPLNDRQQALASWRSAVRHLPVKDRPEEPLNMDRILRYVDTASAIRAGENVRSVATCFNMDTPLGIRQLENEAIKSHDLRSAGSAVRGGRNVQIALKQYGITTPTGAVMMEHEAINSTKPRSAGGAVRSGGNVKAVARRYGIVTPEGIGELEHIAMRSNGPNTAGRAIRSGESAQVVSQRWGITTAKGETDLELLEQETRLLSDGRW